MRQLKKVTQAAAAALLLSAAASASAQQSFDFTIYQGSKTNLVMSGTVTAGSGGTTLGQEYAFSTVGNLADLQNGANTLTWGNELGGSYTVTGKYTVTGTGAIQVNALTFNLNTTDATRNPQNFNFGFTNPSNNAVYINNSAYGGSQNLFGNGGINQSSFKFASFSSNTFGTVNVGGTNLNTSSVAAPASVPEIDGSRLPQGLLIVGGIVLFLNRRVFAGKSFTTAMPALA